MADARFKPIGGMFQGVRGSTDVGGAKKYAGKLVKLNSEGIVDETCLPPDVARAADLSHRLDVEIEERTEGDLALSGRITDLGRVVDSNYDGLSASIGDTAARLQALDEREAGDIASVTGEIDGVKTRMDAAERGIQDNAHSISDINNAISDLVDAETSLRARIAALETSVNGDDTHKGLVEKVSDLNLAYNRLDAAVTTLNGELASWATNLSNLLQEVQNMKQDMDAYKDSTDTHLGEIDDEISSINAKIEEIYNRLVPPNS